LAAAAIAARASVADAVVIVDVAASVLFFFLADRALVLAAEY